TSRSIWRSAVATWPSRPPPVDSAFALYSALLIENSFASCLKPCSAARVYLLAGGEEFLHASGQVFVHVAPVGVALLLHLLGDTGHRTSAVLRQTLALLVVHDVADEAASLCEIIVLRVAAVGTKGQVAAVVLVEQTKLISQAGAGFRAAAEAVLGFTGGHALLDHAGTVGGVLGALAALEAVRGVHRGVTRRELVGHRAVLGVVPVQVLADRAVDRQLGVIGTEAVALSVLVGEDAREQHLVRGEAHARNDVRRRESGLLNLREVVLRVLVQREVTDVDQRVVLLGPGLGQVEGVPAVVLGLLEGHDLHLDIPGRVVAALDGVEEVLSVVVEVTGADDLVGLLIGEGLPALAGLEVVLHPESLTG